MFSKQTLSVGAARIILHGVLPRVPRERTNVGMMNRGKITSDVRAGAVLLYDGGGADLSAIPQIRFEHVIFDHNWAQSMSTLLIVGPEQYMGALSVSVDHCLVYRNYASHYYLGKIAHLWPYDVVVNNTDFIGNRGYGGGQSIAIGSSKDVVPDPNHPIHGANILRAHLNGDLVRRVRANYNVSANRWGQQ